MTPSARLPVTIEMLLTAILGTALYLALGMDLVWVAAGVLGGLLTSLHYRRRSKAREPALGIRRLGQILIGGSLGPALATQRFDELGPQFPALGLSLMAILAGSLVIGRIYSAVFRVDGITAGLATLPGGIGIMASVAADLGRPAALVALIQGLRIALVVSVVPIFGAISGRVSTGGEHTGQLFPSSSLAWLTWLSLVLAAVVGYRLALLMKIPVAPLLGPMLVTGAVAAAMRAAGIDVGDLVTPLIQGFVGQGLLGITVGEYLARPTGAARKAIIGGALGVVATVALAFLIAIGLSRLTSWPFLTCLLVSAPGGAAEMIVLSSAVPEYLHVVVAGQIIRQVAVNMLMPVWLRIFRSYGTTG